MRMPGRLAHAALAFSLTAAAACGGATRNSPGASALSGTPTVDTTPPASDAHKAPSSGADKPSTPSTPSIGSRMKPIMASGMVADLTALGLDPKNLPALHKMPPDKLRGLMKTFSKALGVPCTECHDANDFKAWTPNKKVATKMWDQWVKGLTFEDGSLLYCDSCHQGKVEFLDSHDKKALGKWMDDNFVSTLKRVDMQSHGCATCHGEDMDMQFLDAWKK